MEVNLILKKNTIFIPLFALIFRGFLDISYAFIVSPSFYYAGLNYDFNIKQYLISWILFIFASFFVPRFLLKVSDFVIASSVFFVLAPLTSLYGLDFDRPLEPVIVSMLSIWMVRSIVNFRSISFRIPIIKNGHYVSLILSILSVSYLIVVFLKSGAVLNFHFSKVYEFRSINAALTETGFHAYINMWVFKVFNIYLLAYFLLKRRFSWVILFSIIQIFFFAVSANKGILFYPVILFSIWFFLKDNASVYFLPAALSSVIILSLSSYYFLDDSILSSMLARRVFFIPAHLTFTYFDFFTNNPHVFWSDSVLSYFSIYPYDSSIAKVIGAYMGHEEMSANNGYISSGFAHANFLGVFIYSLIFGFLLKFIDAVSYKNVPLWFGISIVIVPLRQLLVASDFPVVLLTHGLIVSIILLYLSRSKRLRGPGEIHEK